MSLELNTIHLGDCYDLLKQIPDGSIDAVISDFPYNTTACHWDKQPIDLPSLWVELKRVLKPRGVVVTTASQPFTTDLIMSNRKWFRYCWVWNKKFAGNFSTAKIQPMKTFEDVVVFYKERPIYNPQMEQREKPIKAGGMTKTGILEHDYKPLKKTYTQKYPIGILNFPRSLGRSIHSTQKPTGLYEYLIKTYTNPGMVVLDPFAGSGTTGIAAINTDRDFILIEKELEYFDKAKARLEAARLQPKLLQEVG